MIKHGGQVLLQNLLEPRHELGPPFQASNQLAKLGEGATLVEIVGSVRAWPGDMGWKEANHDSDLPKVAISGVSVLSKCNGWHQKIPLQERGDHGQGIKEQHQLPQALSKKSCPASMALDLLRGNLRVENSEHLSQATNFSNACLTVILALHCIAKQL